MPRNTEDDSNFESWLRQAARVSVTELESRLPRTGQVVGEKYRIEEQLGRGGMSTVFRATHLVSQKQVALKWMTRSTADHSAHARLVREALAAGRIDHPNVVDVYDVGYEGDCAYLVMALLRGETLRARLERERASTPFAQAITLLLPAIRGVGAAHRAGVVHRDLKPDNIFLCTDAEGALREAKVLDFGVSALTLRNYAPTLTPTLTKDGMVLGTPAYMSPEQLESAHDSDARTDIYAFGVILYEMFTGERPFAADSYARLVLAIASGHPTPPSQLRADISEALERVVLRALAKDRAQRYATCDALIAALTPFAGETPAPLAVHTTLAALPAARADSRAFVFGAGLVCALGCGLLLFFLLSEPSRPAPALPEPPPSAAAPAPDKTASALYPPPPAAAAAPDNAVYVPSATPPPETMTIAGAAPRSCEQARAAGRVLDGLLRIDPDGAGPVRPFKVLCVGMASASAARPAREYLPLAREGKPAETALNMTRFTYAGGPCACPDLTRSFTHVRLDPRTLTVDPKDGSCATYDRPLSCELQHRRLCGESTDLAWTGAGSCRAADDASGSASIDLRATPFKLAGSARFVPAGFRAAGQATIASDRRTATFVGGGLCGALVPENATVPLVQAR